MPQEGGPPINESTAELPNSRVSLEERLQAGRITWTWPVLIVFARFVFAAIAHALVAGLYQLQGDPAPWQAAAPWWVVYGTAIDLGCLVLLARLMRREGVRLRDLISFDRTRLGRDILLGLGFTVMFGVLFVAGGMIFGPLIYGAVEAPAPFARLPLWGALHALLIWPVVWSITEDMTYLGYSLPRLELLSKRAWPAVALVCFGWAIQHSALPLASDWQWLLYRFASSLPIALVLPIVYLRTRRLLPFIIAHWVVDFGASLGLVFLPSIAP